MADSVQIEILDGLYKALKKQIDFYSSDTYKIDTLGKDERSTVLTELGNIHTKLTAFANSDTLITLSDIDKLKTDYENLIKNIPTGSTYDDTVILNDIELIRESIVLLQNKSTSVVLDETQLLNIKNDISLNLNLDKKADLTISKNLFNINDVNNVVDSFINGLTGAVVSGNTSYNVSHFISVDSNTDYSFSYKHQFAWYDSNKVFISGSTTTTQDILTFKSPSNSKYLRCTIAKTSYSIFQLEKGLVVTMFEKWTSPYLKLTKLLSPLETEMFEKTKNLFDKNNYVSGYFINWITGIPQASDLYACSYYIPILSNTSYFMSGNDNVKYLAWYDSNGIFISGNQNNSFPLVSPINAKFVRVSTKISFVSTTQFEANTIASSYSEPFKLKDIYIPKISIFSQWTSKKWGALGDSITSQNMWEPFPVAKFSLSFINYGVGGTTIAGTSNTCFAEGTRVNDMDSSLDIVSIMGGTNDWAQNIPLGTVTDTVLTTFYGALNTLVSLLLSKYPSKRIFFMTPPYGELYSFASRGWSNSFTNTLNLTIKDYADAVKNICIKYNIPCLDIYQQSGWNSINIRNFINDDGGLLHPNALGGEKIGYLVSDFMDRL